MATNRWQQKVQVWPLTVKEMSTFIWKEMCFTVGWGKFPIWITFRIWLGWVLREPIVPAGRRTQLWMGSRFNMQHFCLNTQVFLLCCWEILLLEDEAAVPKSQAGCFTFRAGRPACLSSAPCSEKSGSNMLRQAPAFDVLPHSTGQRGSHVSSRCCECSLAFRSLVFIWVGTQPFSSPVTAPPQMLFLSYSHYWSREREFEDLFTSEWRKKSTTDPIKDEIILEKKAKHYELTSNIRN